MEERRAWGKFLGQSTAHQQVARVGNQGDDGNFQIGGTGGNQRKGCILTGRSIVEQACKKALNGGQPRIAGCNAQ